MAQDSVEGKPAQATSKRKTGPRAGALLSSLCLLILEIILPVGIASGVLWFLFRSYNLWQMNRTLALVLFAVGLVLISFILSIALDRITSSKRKAHLKQGVKLANGPLTQLAKFALGGVVLPLALFTTAILVNTPLGGTAMDLFVRTSQPETHAGPSEQIVSLVIQARDPLTRTLGIQALAGLHSSRGLGQLIRVLNEGGDVLRDAGLFDVLSKAIASYGVEAKGPLLDSFNKVAPSFRGKSTSFSDDLFVWYFASSFVSLRTEIKDQNKNAANQETRLAQIDGAEAQLKKTLEDLRVERFMAASGDPRLDLILRTFLSMNLSQDADLLHFAKTVAADASYPDTVRGNAFLLIGKLGSTDEFAFLYKYLQTDIRLLQARALEAIITLQTKKPK
jgi:hypothetical protein